MLPFVLIEVARKSGFVSFRLDFDEPTSGLDVKDLASAGALRRAMLAAFVRLIMARQTIFSICKRLFRLFVLSAGRLRVGPVWWYIMLWIHYGRVEDRPILTEFFGRVFLLN